MFFEQGKGNEGEGGVGKETVHGCLSSPLASFFALKVKVFALHDVTVLHVFAYQNLRPHTTSSQTPPRDDDLYCLRGLWLSVSPFVDSRRT